MSTLSRLALLGLCAALAACASPAPKKSGPTPFDRTTDANCYTVDLFTKAAVVPPPEDVPAEWRAYSGLWGSAAWDGKWCHDLHVLSIAANGDVEVMSLHAPYEPWNKPATAFRRKGRIADDGRLRIRSSGVTLEYWLEGDKLYGLRKEGSASLRIAMLPRVNRKF